MVNEPEARAIGTADPAALADRTGCACAEALRFAIITPQEAIAAGARVRLAALLDKYLKGD